MRDLDELFASALEALDVRVAVLDDAGTVLAVNPAWYAFACSGAGGGSVREVGEDYLAVAEAGRGPEGEAGPAIAVGIREVLHGRRRRFSHEYRCEEGWFVLRATRLAGTLPLRAVVAHQNITEWKRAQARLQESNQRFRQLAGNLRENLWIFDPDFTRAVYVSPAYEEISGRTLESLYREPVSFLEIIHPEDRPGVEAVMRTVREGEQGLEFRIVRPDGEVRWGRMRAFPIRNSDGEVYRVAGITEDITRRKRVEQEQRFLVEAGRVLSSSLDYEETLRQVARLAVPQIADWAGVYVVREGGGDAEVRRVELAHADPEQWELAERFRTIALPPEHPVRRVVRTGESLMLQDVHGSSARDPAYVELVRLLGPRSLITVPLLARGRVLGAIHLISAASGRRYGPDDLALAEELARHAALAVDNAGLYRRATLALQARDDVLAIVSHDLRNPLQAISLYADLLREADSPEQQTRYLDAIQRCAQRMGHLIQDLVDVASIEMGRLAMDQAPLAVEPLLKEAYELFHSPAGERSLHLEFEVADDLPPVRADHHRVLQALSNLLGNAVKFTPPGGRVLVRVDREGEGIRFAVTDTGPGIPEGQRDRVFERFWQGRRTYRGSAGLGLAITRGIVESHGGRSGVESREGEGSTFWFTLPAEGTAPPVPAVEAVPARGGTRVARGSGPEADTNVSAHGPEPGRER
ncbi:MAG: PAS domain-containing sensor histidine kinase [Gemmatimonadetes bacterium]|nr:PAS domain-containing sensor histidine kinase [Gemmatimonadota bacterium]